MKDFEPRNFDLNLLRVFDALWATCSGTLAAERLHITPSAVSHALNKLRYALKDDLFVRAPKGMRPTPMAQDIGPRVHNALRTLNASLFPSEFRPDESRRNFRVAATPFSSWALLPGLLPRLQHLAPHVSVRFFRPHMAVFDALDLGLADLAMGAFGRIPTRFEAYDLFRDELVWVMAKAAARDLPGKIGFDFLARVRHIHVMLDGADKLEGVGTIPVRPETMARPAILNDRGDLDSALAELGLHRRVEISVPDVFTAFAVVAAGDCGMLAPLRLAKAAASLHPLRLLELPYRPSPVVMKLVWKGDGTHDPAVDWLCDRIRDVAASI